MLVTEIFAINDHLINLTWGYFTCCLTTYEYCSNREKKCQII